MTNPTFGRNDAATQGWEIGNELSLREVLSLALRLYRLDFVNHISAFLAGGLIIAILSPWLNAALLALIPVPTTAYPLQPSDLFQLLAHEIELLVLVSAVPIAINAIASCVSMRITADALEGRGVNLRASVAFMTRKLPSIFVVGLITSALDFLGTFAFLVPGIIFGIMFSLALPVLMVEDSGMMAALRKSRKLVARRWGKTLGLTLAFGTIALVGLLVGSLVGPYFGAGSNAVSDLIAALFYPPIPIGLTVYCFSNVARIAPQQAGGVSAVRFCPSCGEKLVELNQRFCSRCGQDLGQFQAALRASRRPE